MSPTCTKSSLRRRRKPKMLTGCNRLTQFLQAQPSRAAPMLERPRDRRNFTEGVSLHAGVSVSDLDGDEPSRLAGYCAHPPLSLRRIAVEPDGQLLIRVSSEARRPRHSQALAVVTHAFSWSHRRADPAAPLSLASLLDGLTDGLRSRVRP